MKKTGQNLTEIKVGNKNEKEGWQKENETAGKIEAYTLTLNPALDVTVITDDVEKDVINLTDLKSISAGGKGFNTSRALNCLGIKNTAIAFCGGFFKNDIKRLLKNEKINFYSIPVKDSTRVNIKVIEKKTEKLIELNGKGPLARQGEIKALFDALTNMIYQDSSINTKTSDVYTKAGHKDYRATYFILSGSLPQNIDPGIYGSIIKLLKSKGVKTLLDASGKPLYFGILALPDILKINRQELEQVCSQYFNLSTIDFIAEFIAKGIKMIMITNGPDKIFYYYKNYTYIISPPDIKGLYKTGAGDSVNAGLVYGLLNNFNTEDIAKFAVACGNANILNEIPGKIEMDQVNGLFSKIKVKKQ